MATPASIGIVGVKGSVLTLNIHAGDMDGKMSSTGKSLVLASDKAKFIREDGKEVVVQITAYMPVAK